MRRFFLLSLFFSFQIFAQVTEQKSVDELRKDLEKIEQSIETTRERLNTLSDARFLPDLYFMLAEFLVDKSRYMIIIKQLENEDVPPEEIDLNAEKRSKFQAIDVYKSILEKFPNLKERDRALFFMAHEYRELGQLEDMINTYRKLTAEFPNSPFWSESMLVIGNQFMDQQKDFEGALQSYQRILEKPPGPFTPLARYKMGWAYINLEKYKEALLAFEDVLKLDKNIDLNELPEFYRQTDVRRDALKAMVLPYSEIEPKKLASFGENRVDALKYFFSLSNSIHNYRIVLGRLGTRLSLKGRYIAATRVYFELLRVSNDIEDRVQAIEKLYEAMKKSDKDWPVVGYSREIAKSLNRLMSTDVFNKEEKETYLKNFEIFSRDSATRAQKRAKRTGQKEHYKLAIEAYESYLQSFNARKYEAQIRINLAESYFNIGDLVRAGKQYEFVGRRLRGSNRKKYLDSSLESYIKALKEPELLTRFQVVQARNGLRTVGRFFVKNYKRDPAVENLKFLIGRTYYDERDFDNAVKAFYSYLGSYPRGKESETAANLILDAYNQREDYDKLIEAGKKLVAYKKLDQGLRSDIAEIVRQAEFKKIQVEEGDFSSPEYAKKLLKFAQKFKGSDLGDQALFEAFNSYKAKKDPTAYQAGEQLLFKFGNSKYAKAVVSEMGKMALFTADFARAAKYFEAFAKKYPLDAESKKLLSSAAEMRELMGNFNEAKQDYRALANPTKVAEMDYLSQNWVSLEKSARAIGGIRSNYWRGLALYRRGNSAAARAFFQKASTQASRSFEEQSMAAHSLFLLASESLKSYKKIQIRLGQEAQAVQQKNQRLQDLTNQLQKVIRFGNGTWTIAALYALGQSNREFANFILKSPVPQGLNSSQRQQYKQALNQQAAQYQSTADNFFKQCIQNAEKFEVFSVFVKGCLSKGLIEVDEEKDAPRPSRALDSSPAAAQSIRRKLFDDSRNVKLLINLAKVYNKARDYAMSNLILNRAQSIDPKNASLISMQGVNFIYMNQLEEAKRSFDQALKVNSRDSTALYGIAALYKQFKFSRKFRSARQRANGSGRPSGIFHPWMTSL